MEGINILGTWFRLLFQLEFFVSFNLTERCRYLPFNNLHAETLIRKEN